MCFIILKRSHNNCAQNSLPKTAAQRIPNPTSPPQQPPQSYPISPQAVSKPADLGVKHSEHGLEEGPARNGVNVGEGNSARLKEHSLHSGSVQGLRGMGEGKGAKLNEHSSHHGSVHGSKGVGEGKDPRLNEHSSHSGSVHGLKGMVSVLRKG